MSRTRVAILAVLALLGFAGNSLLCRLALKQTAIDPVSFTTIRIVSGALTLWILLRARPGRQPASGQWLSAIALFAYAIAFSIAYRTLSAATGALLLFGSVQATMLGTALWSGERFSSLQWVGLGAALFGLLSLLLPGLSAPPLLGAALMMSAGIAWGIYSLRGKRASDATAMTAGNFIRAIPFAALATVIAWPWASVDRDGIVYAVASGALASGVGYAIWYAALPNLTATTAATVQLSVPVIAAFGGIMLLAEPMTLRLVFASAAILGGIALVVWSKRRT